MRRFPDPLLGMVDADVIQMPHGRKTPSEKKAPVERKRASTKIASSSGHPIWPHKFLGSH